MKRALPLVCIGCLAPGDEMAAWVEVPAPVSDFEYDDEWQDPSWWTEWDVSMEDAVFVDVDEFMGWEVRLWVSEDGETYAEHPSSPLAVNMSSLGLFQLDGVLVVTGVVDGLRLDDDRVLVALTTNDLESWGVRTWTVDWEEGLDPIAHESLVDPQFTLDSEGELWVWYYTFSRKVLGDPVDIPGPHEMCRADVRSSVLFTEVDCPLAVEAAADPSPLWNSTHWVVPMTLRMKSDFSEQLLIHTWVEGEASEELTLVDGGSVPYLRTTANGALEIWYQSWNDVSHPRPTRIESTDGGQTWSEPEFPLGKDGECTSPVYTRWGSLHLVICAADQGDYHTE